ncbi:MAG: sigma-54 dependent transcriptional regulator [Planctomycetota bacterium]|nr:sigma-54 dependent transcriptional regulator [Planctomycetota bacterium]
MTTPMKKSQPSQLSILFADDEPSLQELMRMELPHLGHRVTVCPDGYTAVAALERENFDCLIVDLDMPGMNGIQVIERAATLSPKTEAIVLTGKQSLESAVSALRFGVIDYLSKPCRLSELQSLLQRVAARRELKRNSAALDKQSASSPSGSAKLIGSSSAMQEVLTLIRKVARTQSTVLIRGETGCGKELVARALHDQSSRNGNAFVAVNCGALPENLIESELFGHKKGAFTGADAQREGLFEVASGGTIFLDEIGELPLAMQAKLLRVLESGDIRRVGDNQTFHVDVRVVCATHRDVETMVESGDFREDLMFRINAFEIHVPSLRDRMEDVLPLARHLYLRHRPEHASIENIFAEETIAVFKQHPWPGNVRELANVVEHATILCDQPPILPEHLPRHFGDKRAKREIKANSLPTNPLSLREMESLAVQEAIQRHQGNKPAAAEELGISLKTLYNKLNQSDLANKRTG